MAIKLDVENQLLDGSTLPKKFLYDSFMASTTSSRMDEHTFWIHFRAFCKEDSCSESKTRSKFQLVMSRYSNRPRYDRVEQSRSVLAGSRSVIAIDSRLYSSWEMCGMYNRDHISMSIQRIKNGLPQTNLFPALCADIPSALPCHSIQSVLSFPPFAYLEINMVSANKFVFSDILWFLWSVAVLYQPLSICTPEHPILTPQVGLIIPMDEFMFI